MKRNMNSPFSSAHERGLILIQRLKDQKELITAEELLNILEIDSSELKKLEKNHSILFIQSYEDDKLYPVSQLDKNKKPFEFLTDLYQIYNKTLPILRLIQRIPKKYHHNKYTQIFIDEAKAEQESSFT